MANPRSTQAGDGQQPLSRLLEDLVRDGWLMGMNAGMDPVLARMDPVTGVFNREHFEAIAQESIADCESGRDPRPGDGPAAGVMAVVSVRLLDWQQLGAALGGGARDRLVSRVARVLEQALRADDVIGRTGDDTFSLLLRGCPPDRLAEIARRCQASVEAEELRIEGRVVKVRALAAAAQWDWGDASDIIAASRPAVH
jgi:diguanylate cyclase (GGDEF)-like protein